MPHRTMAPRWQRALAGFSAAAAGLGLAELIAGLWPGAPSPIVVVGNALIAIQPAGAKDLVVTLFGEADKLVLNVVIGAGALALASGVGLIAPRRPQLANGAFAMAGLVVLGLALLEPLVEPIAAVVALTVAVAVAVRVLHLLTQQVASPATMPDWGRRRFLGTAVGVAATATIAGSLGRLMLDRRLGGTPVGVAAIPEPTDPAPALPAGADLGLPGLTPIVTPNEQFYRIDTALLVPRLDARSWRLKLSGMVEHPFELGYEELLAMPLREQYVTIACVSNEVGGDLVGNALWSGVPLSDLLDRGRPHPDASQIVGRAYDGWTAGFPTAWVAEPEREALVAVSMNGEPLPARHGFPARLIVPGLYGYVSATKWLTEIELTTLEAFDAYWVPLGWAKEAPILTQSRIDLPRSGARVTAGEVAVAGVAWAPDRGIERVELSIDGAAWSDAELSAPIGAATWVQWLYRWRAEPGAHRIKVRATDGAGETQTADRSPPAPDGARGHHTVEVTVV